jgi:hypothetical protein
VILARAGGCSLVLGNGDRACCFPATATTIAAAHATTCSMGRLDGTTSSAVRAASHTAVVRATASVRTAAAVVRSAAAGGPYLGASVVGAPPFVELVSDDEKDGVGN